ncbi:MAG: hypothetical protein AAGM04_13880 [Pseudomonadota bacterium]
MAPQDTSTKDTKGTGDTEGTRGTQKGLTQAELKAERLRKALRANLHRRRQKAQSQKSSNQTDDGEANL